jgi:hypothetical protein
MPRRVSLPGASELFRPTQAPEPETPVPEAPVAPAPSEQDDATTPARRGSGRVRHDEKITVYVSSDELLALEQARLTLRARHGMAVDRGRIVREAISALLDDLQASGESSELVRRLSQP